MSTPVAPVAPSPPHAPESRRFTREALLVGLMVAMVHLVFRLSGDFLVGVLNDDGVYVALGKAIADGRGYRSIHLVGEPVQLRYPPGLPLLLAIPWTLGGTLETVYATVGVLNLVVTASAAGLVWWIGRRRLGASPWTLAVFAVGPFLLDPTIQYFNIALTEPYLVLGWAAGLALAYPLFERASGDPNPHPQPSRAWQAAGVGLVLAATTLFRTAGIALLPGMLLALVLHRRWTEAAACGAAMLIPLLAWEALQAGWVAGGQVSAYPDDLGYWRWLGVEGPLGLAAHAARSVGANVVEYVRKLASYLFSIQWLGVLVLFAAAVGAAVTCLREWRSHTALALTTLAACGLTLLWPFAQGRLLLPLLPFLGLLVASAAEIGIRRAPSRFRWGPHVVLGLLALAVAFRQAQLRQAATRAYQRGVLPPPEELSPTLMLAVRARFISRVNRAMEEYTQPVDRIMVDAPAAVYLYTGRRTVAAVPTESRLAASVFAAPGAYLARRILGDSVTVVVWAPPAEALQRDILTIMERCPQVLRREPPDFPAVFRVVGRDADCLRSRILGFSVEP